MNGVTNLPPDLWVPQQTHRALRDNIQPQWVVVRGIQFLNRKELTQARLRIWSVFVCVCGGGGEEYCNSYTLLHTALLWNYILLTYNTRQLLKRQTLHTHKHTNTQTILALVLHWTDWSILQLHWQECYPLPLAPGCHTAAASSTVWSSLCTRSLWAVQRSAGGPQTGCLPASGMEAEGKEEGEGERRERGEGERRQRSGEIWRWRERQSIVQMNRLGDAPLCQFHASEGVMFW